MIGARALLTGLLVLLVACAGAKASEPEAVPPPDERRLVRGDLRERWLLTGQLETAVAEAVVVPRTPEWNITLRWIEKDGARVKAGQKIAELDDSAFARDLLDKKLAAAKAKTDLEHQERESAVQALERAFAVDEARIALEKAKLEAAVAPDSYPLRVYQEKQVALRRREVALEKALDEQRAQREAARLEARVLAIALEKRQREIAQAEQAIEALTLEAPRDGLVIVGVHPWLRRKFESGDNVWVGLPLLMLPELSTMRVSALLSDVDDGRVQPGMRAQCFLDAYPGMSIGGTVTDVSAIAREPPQRSLRRSFFVNVELDRVDLDRMLPGMSVRVEVSGKEARGELIAPRASLDLGASPPRLERRDGSSTPVDVLSCNAQSCAVRAPAAGGERLEPGLLLGAVKEGA